MSIGLTTTIFLALGAIVLVLWLFVRYTAHKESDRSVALEDWAKQNGDKFFKNVPTNKRPLGMELLEDGLHAEIKNMLTGVRDGGQVTVFDHHFSNGKDYYGQSGVFHVEAGDTPIEKLRSIRRPRSSNVVKQTVVYLESNDISLPAIHISPRTLIHHLGKGVRHQNEVLFDNLPDHLVSADEKELVLSLFNEELIEFIKQLKKMTIRMSGKSFVISSGHKRVMPERYEEFIENAQHCLFLFQASLKSANGKKA